MELAVPLPQWIRAWYLVNIIMVLPFDWLFVILRPHSLAGGYMARFFPVFQLYAELDTLFANLSDTFLLFMYGIFQPVDMAVMAYLAYQLRKHPVPLGVAMVCVCEGVFCFTKTTLYVVYSWPFIVEHARVGISILNSAWALVSCLVSFSTCRAIFSAAAVYDAAASKDK
jgi:hypothetical protein